MPAGGEDARDCAVATTAARVCTGWPKRDDIEGERERERARRSVPFPIGVPVAAFMSNGSISEVWCGEGFFWCWLGNECL